MQKSGNPTIKDVARLAGVSYQTVSNVVNGETRITDETRRKVLEAIETLGYQPHAAARSLRSGKSKIIGLMIPDAHNPHFWDSVAGAEDEANRHGYSILLATTTMDPERERKAFNALVEQRPDGIIPMFTYPENFIEDLHTLKRKRLPVAISFSGAPMPEVEVDVVWAHFELAARELMDHLLGLGHQRIAMIWGVGRSVLANDRTLAYRGCLEGAGIPYDPGLLVSCGNTLEDSICATEKILGLSPIPSAIIGINDLMAFGAMQTAMRYGLHIPQDISIAGFDDLPMSRFLFPSLTTGKADGVEIGRQCVQMIIQRLANPDLPQQIMHLPTGLVVRGSTGPCPTHPVYIPEISLPVEPALR
jgi:DNA-binding LacI/PurR family transcriptional regulator